MPLVPAYHFAFNFAPTGAAIAGTADSRIIITKSEIKYNNGTTGGGLYLSSSFGFVEDSIISSNNAILGDGIFVVGASEFRASSINCFNNTANEGGCENVRNSIYNITSSTITSNIANGGAGNYFIGANVFVKDTEFTFNIGMNSSFSSGVLAETKCCILILSSPISSTPVFHYHPLSSLYHFLPCWYLIANSIGYA